MKITYTFEGKQYTLELRDGGQWHGGHEGMAAVANHFFDEFVTAGRSAYFPTPWHRAKALADKLGGTVDLPEPVFETGDHPGKVF